jgi:hypothetical protein
MDLEEKQVVAMGFAWMSLLARSVLAQQGRGSEGMNERCAMCGWVGREADKAHSGLSGLKGPGFCPDCGAQDFAEESA